MRVRGRVKICRDDKSVEVDALFDAGSARSYLSDRVATQLGYEPYDKPRRVPLAVKDRYAEVVGHVPAVEVEIAGYRLPEGDLGSCQSPPSRRYHRRQHNGAIP